MAAGTFGISPISLFQARQDWFLHLAISPGKQREVQVKAMGKALAEGLSTGHPDMPEFVASPAQIDATLAYIRSLNP